MKPLGALAGLLLAAAPLLVPAAVQAQPAPPLIYAQPLAPGAVMQVQERLRQAGAYSGRVDGVWGPDSQAALERFQQGRGLQVTGQLNPATTATLGLSPAELVAAAQGPVPPVAAVPPPPMEALSPAAVRNVQRRLRMLGFYRGPIDGVWGPGTQAGLERFQQGRGLQATGQINPATVAALGLDPNNPAVPPLR